MHCTAPKLPGHAQGHGPVWVSCDAGHGPRDRRDTSSGQNLKILAPALSLQGGGVPLLVHRLPGTLSASCHRRRVLFLQLVGAHAAGMGRVTPAQGRAGLPPGLKDKPTDQTPCPPALKVLLPQGDRKSVG